ncbi:MAG TPA: hypothetical protein VGO11_15850, partial [Chthoniobacteraceae bacterium]|nr:hypothetical protein [Chthoniobacteraceae bacterium]
MNLKNSERKRIAPVVERRCGFFSGKSGSFVWVVIASACQVGKGGWPVAGTKLFLGGEPVGASGLGIEDLRFSSLHIGFRPLHVRFRAGSFGRSLAAIRTLPIAHRFFGRLLGAYFLHPRPPPEPTRGDGEAENDGGGDLEAAVEGAQAGGFGFGAGQFLADQLRAIGGVALGELAERDAEQAGGDFEQAELEPGAVGFGKDGDPIARERASQGEVLAVGLGADEAFGAHPAGTEIGGERFRACGPVERAVAVRHAEAKLGAETFLLGQDAVAGFGRVVGIRFAGDHDGEDALGPAEFLEPAHFLAHPRADGTARAAQDDEVIADLQRGADAGGEVGVGGQLVFV